MTTKTNQNDYVCWSTLEHSFRDRAKKHERSGFIDMVIIVFTLLMGIAIFVGSDKISDLIFKLPAERQADKELRLASAKLLSSVASLGEPLSDVIRSLPREFRPLLENFLDQYIQRQTNKLSPADIQAADTRPPEPAVPLQDKSSAPHTSPQPTVSVPPPEERRSLGLAPEALPKQNPQPDIPEMKQIIDVYQLLIAQYEKNVELAATIAQRQELSFGESNHIMQYDSERDIATYRADTDRDVAVYRADTDRDIAEYVSTEWNSLVSSALTRVGAVVLVIWLIKIFVKKRQRAVKASSFYLGISDAVAMSNKDLKSFLEILPFVLPPEEEKETDNDTPVDSLVKLLSVVANKPTGPGQ